MNKIYLKIGDVAISTGPAIMETILGSCVSICLWDETTKLAGMNHYMLPDLMDDIEQPERFGPGSIKRLLSEIKVAECDSGHLKAKIFGGGNVVRELSSGFEIGKKNVELAREMMLEHNIPVISEYTGNECGIKVVFHSETGRVFVRKLEIECSKSLRCEQCL